MSTLAPERPAAVDDLERQFAASVPCESVFEDVSCPRPAEWRMYLPCPCDADPALYCDPCRRYLIDGVLPYYEVACQSCGLSVEPRFEPL